MYISLGKVFQFAFRFKNITPRFSCFIRVTSPNALSALFRFPHLMLEHSVTQQVPKWSQGKLESYEQSITLYNLKVKHWPNRAKVINPSNGTLHFSKKKKVEYKCQFMLILSTIKCSKNIENIHHMGDYFWLFKIHNLKNLSWKGTWFDFATGNNYA